VRSREWNDKIVGQHRATIRPLDVQEAFDLLVAGAERLSTYQCEAGLHGVIRVFRYHDVASGELPFAFIVNKNSLLFYIRKPGLRRINGGVKQLSTALRNVSENASGEITIRVSSSADAERLAGSIFHSPAADATKPVLPDKPQREVVMGMTKLTVPAARVRQGDLTLYATSISVRDLLAEGFYSVETLDPDNADDSGFQRLLNVARARKLADYILKGQDSNDAFLPTSVFLATDKSMPFDEVTNTLSIDTQAVGAFSVVDGQHRLEGLRIAAEKDPRVHDFQLPVNIAVGLPKIAQMCHFLIVNTTQKSVDKSVEQRLIARLTAAIDVEDVPTLPKWILRAVERGEVDKAVRYADFLNETEDSPWFGKIKMANTESDTGTINQRSFVKAIVKYVLTANNPLTAIRDFDKEKKIFLNYWKAIKELLDDGDAAVLYKYNGVELFCKFSIPFFMKLQDKGSFTVRTMTDLLRECFENVEGEYAGVGHPEWWASGSSASFLNAGAINQVSQELSRALHKVSMGGRIEL
jgi:DGQHR domain-containing protein